MAADLRCADCGRRYQVKAKVKGPLPIFCPKCRKRRARQEKVRTQPKLGVRCPVCSSVPGQTCRTTTTRKPRKPHPELVTASGRGQDLSRWRTSAGKQPPIVIRYADGRVEERQRRRRKATS
jgi:DNA-directed RNA polymerase subunit RPC12/RpoP